VDNGTGVPAAARGQLFAPFFTTKGSEGTGLGLYLSRSFAQAHGGDLELARTSEHGSTFALHIPAITPSRVAPAPRQPTPIPARPSAARVLVVDDEGAIVRGITRWIGKRAQVTGCCDPVEALELASRGDYALILCDLDMPRMTGMDFVRALEQRNAETASRVVIMTGGDASSVAPTIRVVPKPLSPNLLEELLRAA
jgi:CheY-like chemotaxis protein